MGFWRRGNYAFNTVEMIVDWASKPKFRTDEWYVGVTANPVASLTAHGFDIYWRDSFDCWDIPAENAMACKEAILALRNCRFITDPESDYIDDTYPILYIYLYPLTLKSVQHIDPSGFAPLAHIPNPPIVLKYIDRQDKETIVRYGDDFTKQDLEQLLEEIKERVLAGALNGLIVKPRRSNFMEFQFGENCCIISYDTATSQSGCFQSYRSGSTSRKLVELFTGEYPAYMVCSDMAAFMGILRYFLTKSTKPGKRQNVKWVVLGEDKDIRKYCKNILSL